MTTTLHRDSWDQYAAIMEKENTELKAEIERLRAALEKIADPDIAWGHMKHIARETLSSGDKPT